MQLAGNALKAAGSAYAPRQRQHAPARPLGTRPQSQSQSVAGAVAARTIGRVRCNSKQTKRPERAERIRTAAAGDQTLPLVDDDRIPVTVITGFLGSGKTTLLNYILTQNHGQRIAVIENEFGEIDIDSELVVRKEVLEGTGGDMIMQLGNGCLCCTVREDLVNVLNKLWKRRKDFDHILIETTGLANPAPIISSFYMDQQLPGRVRLDGVVTVVDAKHVLKRLDEVKENEDIVNEAVEQIAYADRIILNKIDLVSRPELSSLEQRLRTINSLASIQRTQRSEVPVDYVLGVGGFDLGRIEEQVVAEQSSHGHGHEHSHDCAPGCTDPSHNHSHDHHHDHDHAHSHEHGHEHSHGHEHGHEHSHGHAEAAHSHEHGADCAPGCTDPTHDHSHHALHQHHDDKVSSVSFVVEGDMDLEKVNYTMGALLNARGEDLYRMKGILSIQGLDERYVFQAVHQMFEGSPDRPWREDERRTSRMVLIGRELDKEAFEEAFTRCLADAPRGAAGTGMKQTAAV